MRIEGLNKTGVLTPGTKKGSGEASSFQSVLDSVQKVSDLQTAANEKAAQLASGQDVDVHQVMIASEKAALALDLTIAVRNKVIEAYQELMRMQI